jgi:hypothetical protein
MCFDCHICESTIATIVMCIRRLLNCVKLPDKAVCETVGEMVNIVLLMISTEILCT